MVTTQDYSIGADGLVHGLQPRPIPQGPATVARILEGRDPDRVALIDAAGELTYGELDRHVRAAAAALAAMGLQQGDRIAACCVNHSAMIIAFLASQRLGLVWNGVNRVLADAEKCAQLLDAEARVLLADPAVAETLATRKAELPKLDHILTTGTDAALEWPTLIAENLGKDAAAAEIDPFAPAALSYTSGTTGLPKGAVHTQHSIMAFINGAIASNRGGIWQPDIRRSVTIALTILNGMTYGPLAALASGGSFVSMDRIDSTGVAEWIARTRIQALCCTPPTIHDFLFKDSLQAMDLSSLAYAMAGGAAGSAELYEPFRARFGSELINEYGMTEAPSGVAGSRCDQLPPDKCVGKPYSHLEIAALDDNAVPLPQGETGEIGIRAIQTGPWAGVFTGMRGYWRQPEETAATFRNGWMCTGDLGFLDPEGNLAIVGRKKEMIIRGGANVYPAEIERVLRLRPEIKDAVVLGIADQRLGEIVGAWLLLNEGVEESPELIKQLTEACAEQLARYKVPARWLIVDDIPRNAMNKPDRKTLRTVPARELVQA
nr:class I adenylate-forming enzyme family protein [Sphingomonas sp. CDS-1]